MRWCLLLATSLAVSATRADAAETARPPAKLAVVEFAMVDTSGEPRDQQAQHAKRLQAMMAQIRSELARSGEFRPVDLAGNSAAPTRPIRR